MKRPHCYDEALSLTHVHRVSLPRIRVAIADSNLAQAEVVARSLSQDALAVGVDAAKWESQAEAFERVLRDLGRVDYVYASKYTLYIPDISGTLGKHQAPVARGNEADTI